MEISRTPRSGGRSSVVTTVRTGGTAKTAKRSRAADRLEISKWMAGMEEQRLQAEQELQRRMAGSRKADEKSGLWGLLDQASQSSGEEDALLKQLDVQEKCAKIAASIMKGKKVPKQDEQYLMENDPKGYLMAIMMRQMEEEDDEECRSVLTEEDFRSGSGGDTGAETVSGGESAAPGGGEAAAE